MRNRKKDRDSLQALMFVVGFLAAGLILVGATLSHSAPLSSYPTKATPADADKVLLVDSEDSNSTKLAAVSTLPGGNITLSDISDAGAAAGLDATNGVIGDVVVYVDGGSCSDTQYTTEVTCEAALETWTPAAAVPIDAAGATITDTGSLITATTIEGALAENRTAINLNTAKETNTDNQSASEVAVTATGFSGNLSGTDTDVQTALATLDAMTAGGASAIADLSDWPAAVSATEVGYLDGVTSAIQTQLNALSGGGTVEITQQTNDPTAATMDTGDMIVATTSGDLFYKSSTGFYSFAGSFTADDTTPSAFSFVDQTDVELEATITSAAIEVAGINAKAAISITGGTYDINASGSFTSDAGTVVLGDDVRARHTSSGSAATAVDTVVTIGGVSDTFTSTTEAAASSYSLLYDADHSSGETYAYLSSGSSQGTAAGTVTYPAGGTDPGTASPSGGDVVKIDSWSAGIEWSNSTPFWNSSEGRISFEYYNAASANTNELIAISGTSNDILEVKSLSNNTISVVHRSGGGTPVICTATSTATFTDSEWITIQARWDVAEDTCGVKVGDAAWVDTTQAGMVAHTAENASVGIGHSDNNGISDRPAYFDNFTVWSTYAD